MISKEVDGKTWINNPEYRYVYNKIWLCEKQDIRCAPSGVEPEDFPVFYKPIYNMYSLGAHSFKAESKVEDKIHPGLFWMDYLEGDHWTIDCDFDGRIKDPLVLEAVKENDVFKFWKEYNFEEFYWINNFLRKNLTGYRGPLNLEGIGQDILEIHLRKSEQMLEYRDFGLNYCIPFFGKDGTYKVREGLLDNLLENYENIEVRITVVDGEPELGIEDNRRLGYLFCDDKDIGYEVKSRILNEVTERTE